jgi:Fe-S-cluster-containing hydrogenase component 2
MKEFLLNLFRLTPAPATYEGDKRVASDPARCVQCGVCGYNCPVGIMVRDYARAGKIVDDPNCVQCGQCIDACPRGTLRWNTHGAPELILPSFDESMLKESEMAL